MITFPNAKINIGLNVVKKRPDGYHNLETIFYPVKLADALEVVEAGETAFTSSGIEIDATAENNLVYKAYSLLAGDFDLPPVKMHLHKVIPFGAGLGGGSADAAFALKMVNEYFTLGLTTTHLEDYAARIGADCPFFIENKPTFAHGIGDQFKPVNLDLSAFEIVIVKPSFSVSTPQAYRNIVPTKPDFNLLEIDQLPIEDWKTVVKKRLRKKRISAIPRNRKSKRKTLQSRCRLRFHVGKWLGSVWYLSPFTDRFG